MRQQHIAKALALQAETVDQRPVRDQARAALFGAFRGPHPAHRKRRAGADQRPHPRQPHRRLGVPFDPVEPARAAAADPPFEAGAFDPARRDEFGQRRIAAPRQNLPGRERRRLTAPLRRPFHLVEEIGAAHRIAAAIARRFRGEALRALRHHRDRLKPQRGAPRGRGRDLRPAALRRRRPRHHAGLRQRLHPRHRQHHLQRAARAAPPRPKLAALHRFRRQRPVKHLDPETELRPIARGQRPDRRGIGRARQMAHRQIRQNLRGNDPPPGKCHQAHAARSSASELFIIASASARSA